MTILVTGGAGFIGANFVHYQLKEHPEERVVCLDALTYAGNLENLTEALQNPRFRFVKGDIADRETVNALFEEEKPDIVVNFAAESHVDRSITQPELFLRTNILGTQVLMDACRKVGVGRIIRCPQTRSTAICRWTGRISFSPKIRPSIRLRPTPPARLRRICWCWPITVPSICR